MITETSRYRIEESYTPDALKALRPQWSALVDRCTLATPFQSPEWLLPWWELFGRGDLWAVTVREENRLAGLAPMYISRSRRGSPRQLSFLGTGVPGFPDMLVEPHAELQGARMVLDYISSRKDKWEIADFRGLRPYSPFLAVTEVKGVRRRVLIPENRAVLSLPASVTELRTCFVPFLLNRLSQSKKYLEKKKLSRHKALNGKEVREFLSHLTRFAADTRNPVDSGHEQFFVRTAEGLLKRGWLSLSALVVRERIAAVQYGISAGGNLYLCAGGQDPNLARYNPLWVLTEAMLEEAVREGLAEVHFPGGGEKNKNIWGALGRRRYSLLLWYASDESVPVPASAPGKTEGH